MNYYSANYEKKIANRVIGVLIILCLILTTLLIYLAMFTFVVVQAKKELENINISAITAPLTGELGKINTNIQQGMENINQGLTNINNNINRLIGQITNGSQEVDSILSVLGFIREDLNSKITNK